MCTYRVTNGIYESQPLRLASDTIDPSERALPYTFHTWTSYMAMEALAVPSVYPNMAPTTPELTQDTVVVVDAFPLYMVTTPAGFMRTAMNTGSLEFAPLFMVAMISMLEAFNAADFDAFDLASAQIPLAPTTAARFDVLVATAKYAMLLFCGARATAHHAMVKPTEEFSGSRGASVYVCGLIYVVLYEV